jgi:hypothetical protein
MPRVDPNAPFDPIIETRKIFCRYPQFPALPTPNDVRGIFVKNVVRDPEYRDKPRITGGFVSRVPLARNVASVLPRQHRVEEGLLG